MIPSAVYVVAAALQNKFPLSSKFLRNPGSMPKKSTHVLSTWGKYMAGFLVKSFWECCGSTVLTGASCWPSSNYIPVQKIVSLSTELNHNRSSLVLYSDNGVWSPHLFIVYIRVLRTAARGTNPTCEAISPGRKTHFANNEKNICENVLIW